MDNRFEDLQLKRYGFVFVIFIIAILISLLLYQFPFFNFQAERDQITKVYFADNISDAHRALIQRFNEEYAGSIQVIPVDLPFTKFTTNERKELLARMLRGEGGQVDIFSVDHIWIPRFAKWAEPLSPFLSHKHIESIIPQVLVTSYYQSVLVGVPLYLDLGVMLYRRDLLARIPNSAELEARLKKSLTWKEFLAIREAYYPNEPYYVFQGDSYEGLICNYLEVYGGNGGRLEYNNLDELTGQKAKTAIELLTDFIHGTGVSPESVIRFNENESYWYALENDIPFFRGWPTMIGNSPCRDEDTVKVQNLAFCALPHFDGSDAKTVFGGWNLMISKHSKVKAEAAEFIKFAISHDAQFTIYHEGHLLPVLHHLYHDEELIRTHPDLLYVKELIGTGIHRPPHKDYTRISDVLAKYLNLILAGELSAEEGLELARQGIQSILDRGKYYP